jgi:ABC-type multidrug transport system ATPase subunit
MLSGLFNPTTGEATIDGLDIHRDMDLIRKKMSVTPQVIK